MAIIRVQATDFAPSSSQTPQAAYASNNAAGNLLVCVISISDGTVTSSSVPTDTLGNTWVLADSALSANSNLYVYFVANCLAGANTVTLHLSGIPTVRNRIHLYEYSGVAIASPLDVHTSIASSTNGSSTSASIGPLTATNSGELGFVSFKNQSNNNVMSPFGGGYTDVIDSTVVASGDNLSVTGSTTATATKLTSDAYGAVLALFKAPAPPPPVSGAYSVPDCRGFWRRVWRRNI